MTTAAEADFRLYMDTNELDAGLLGLSHPHDDGGSSTVLSGVTGPFGDYGDFNLN